MADREQTDRLIGDGVVRLPDGTEIATRYDVRIYEHYQTLTGPSGSRRRRPGFQSYEVSLDHDGNLRPRAPSTELLELVMDDGRRLMLSAVGTHLEHGVARVVASGDILPALPID